ncbi:MAG: hypothetical protein ACYC2Y_07025 [Armatimonadota bacterium]
MATAYTPGLTVTPRIIIRKTRRLPLKGEVVVKIGDEVQPDTVVARTDLPGIMQTVRVAESLGIDASEVAPKLRVSVGDVVSRGEVIASSKSLFGLLTSECKSPIDGTVELISHLSGHVGIRRRSTPVEVTAYIRGRVVETIPEEGVVVEAAGALIQGIFGVGGERLGAIRMLADSPDEVIDADRVGDCAGQVLVAGANITVSALRAAAEKGAAAIVVGGIVDRDLIDYLGHDIGVAITGQEKVPTTLVVTEGFGVMQMARRTFDLLKSLEGETASVNGATQIRAGVIRPEIVVPSQSGAEQSNSEQLLDVGARIRVIREPYFGALGTVTALPPEPVVIESGAKVRILDARLDDGRTASVPRANVEIIQE